MNIPSERLKVSEWSRARAETLAMPTGQKASPLLALFIRSVREESRHWTTYGARAGLGAFLLLVVWAVSGEGWTGAPGLKFFKGVVWFELIGITIFGLSYFAAAISEEKEEQTLGLLRMTGLSPLVLLLGKSASRLSGALLLVAGQIPFTIFAITLGGVSFEQIGAAYCTLGAYIFLLSNLAVLAAVMARRTAGAVASCALLLVAWFGGVPLFLYLRDETAGHADVSRVFGTMGTMLWKATPMQRLGEILGTEFSGPLAGRQVESNLAIGLACFLLAWLALDCFGDRFQEGAASAVPVGGRTIWTRCRRRPRAWRNAFFWKDFFFLQGGALGLGLRTLCYGLTLCPFVLRAAGSQGWIASLAQVMFILAPFAFSIDLVLMASRMFGSEQRERALASLGTLPCSMCAIAWRKALACVMAAAPAGAIVLTAQVLSLESNTYGVKFSPFDYDWIGPLFYVWLGMALMIHVTVFLSLYLKRGAAPLGYVITFVGAVVLVAITSMVFARNALWFAQHLPGLDSSLLYEIVHASVCTVAIVSLHVLGLRRLKVLAAES
ncbi:MAG TPA: hypothetical protein VGM54_17525 [Chthoniobacter sp.]|jgi:hypothetical protein